MLSCLFVCLSSVVPMGWPAVSVQRGTLVWPPIIRTVVCRVIASATRQCATAAHSEGQQWVDFELSNSYPSFFVQTMHKLPPHYQPPAGSENPTVELFNLFVLYLEEATRLRKNDLFSNNTSELILPILRPIHRYVHMEFNRQWSGKVLWHAAWRHCAIGLQWDRMPKNARFQGPG